MIIQVSGDFGTDYGFLSARCRWQRGGRSFRGTAASVQDRNSGLVLALGAKGEVRYHDYALAADMAASLRIARQELHVELPEKIIDGDKTLQPMIPHAGGTVTLVAPGKWALAEPLPGASLAKAGSAWVLRIPSGVRSISLVREK